MQRVDNGLLLRTDIHTRFDAGYVTISADHRCRVSQWLKADWNNGQVYYDLEGGRARMPTGDMGPRKDDIDWHGSTIFHG